MLLQPCSLSSCFAFKHCDKQLLGKTSNLPGPRHLQCYDTIFISCFLEAIANFGPAHILLQILQMWKHAKRRSCLYTLYRTWQLLQLLQRKSHMPNYKQMLSIGLQHMYYVADREYTSSITYGMQIQQKLQTHIWIRVPGCWQPENFSEMQVLEIRHCRWSTSHRHRTSQWSAHTWLKFQNASRISVPKRSTRYNVIKSNLQLSVVPSHPSLLPVSFFPGLFYVGLHWFGIFVVSIVATRAVVMRQRRQWQAQAQTLLQHHRRSRATWTTCFGPAPKT